MRPLVEEVGSGLGLPRAGAIDWSVEIDPEVMIDADPDQLFRVFTNLIRNSVQVLDGIEPPRQNRITVGAVVEPDGTSITVSDSGPGVPRKAREKLFVPFQGSARKGGTGLGLAIVAEIVTAHGGSVELVDGGTGATFQLTIPSVGSPSAPALEHHTAEAAE